MNDPKDPPSREPVPDADRYSIVVERTMAASAQAIYDAWTSRFDTWFATPGDIVMNPVPGAPYWFSVEHEGERYPHYGRFLNVDAGA